MAMIARAAGLFGIVTVTSTVRFSPGATVKLFGEKIAVFATLPASSPALTSVRRPSRTTTSFAVMSNDIGSLVTFMIVIVCVVLCPTFPWSITTAGDTESVPSVALSASAGNIKTTKPTIDFLIISSSICCYLPCDRCRERTFRDGDRHVDIERVENHCSDRSVSIDDEWRAGERLAVETVRRSSVIRIEQRPDHRLAPR